jgi:hypothetical protein
LPDEESEESEESRFRLFGSTPPDAFAGKFPDDGGPDEELPSEVDLQLMAYT